MAQRNKERDATKCVPSFEDIFKRGYGVRVELVWRFDLVVSGLGKVQRFLVLVGVPLACNGKEITAGAGGGEPVRGYFGHEKRSNEK